MFNARSIVECDLSQNYYTTVPYFGGAISGRPDTWGSHFSSKRNFFLFECLHRVIKKEGNSEGKTKLVAVENYPAEGRISLLIRSEHCQLQNKSSPNFLPFRP